MPFPIDLLWKISMRREQTADTKQLGDDVTSWCHIEHKANEDWLFVSGKKKKKRSISCVKF